MVEPEHIGREVEEIARKQGRDGERHDADFLGKKVSTRAMPPRCKSPMILAGSPAKGAMLEARQGRKRMDQQAELTFKALNERIDAIPEHPSVAMGFSTKEKYGYAASLLAFALSLLFAKVLPDSLY